VAQVHVVTELPPTPTPELIHYSHNLLLDLLVWNGIPLGLALIGAGAWWLYRALRAVDNPRNAMLVAAIGIVLTHALLEYPHAYAFFLLPLGIFVGTLSASQAVHRAADLPRAGVAAVLVLTSLAIGWTSADYVAAKRSLERLRYENNRVGPYRNSPPPDLQLLTQLDAWLTVDRFKVKEPLSGASYELMRKTIERYPGDILMLRYAMASADRGNDVEAELTLRRLCLLYSSVECGVAREAWEKLGADMQALQRVPFPTPAARLR